MRINPFDSFTVRPASNGFIVEPEREPHTCYDTTSSYVFTTFDDFVVWAKERTQMPDDDS